MKTALPRWNSALTSRAYVHPCPAVRRNDPFGMAYHGWAFPQHVVDTADDHPGDPMQAVKNEAGDWYLLPAGRLDT